MGVPLYYILRVNFTMCNRNKSTWITTLALWLSTRSSFFCQTVISHFFRNCFLASYAPETEIDKYSENERFSVKSLPVNYFYQFGASVYGSRSLISNLLLVVSAYFVIGAFAFLDSLLQWWLERCVAYLPQVQYVTPSDSTKKVVKRRIGKRSLQWYLQSK